MNRPLELLIRVPSSMKQHRQRPLSKTIFAILLSHIFMVPVTTLNFPILHLCVKNYDRVNFEFLFLLRNSMVQKVPLVSLKTCLSVQW